MTEKWEYYPDSPWGDVDICVHGCIRGHGARGINCTICDLQKDAELKLQYCKKCDAMTWHWADKCLRCESSEAEWEYDR
uniref:Uncharacterized protein n=1 Tax=viral metagenome TaxID=1070528 RepID=A0A6M3IEH2_9ZZZZ